MAKMCKNGTQDAKQSTKGHTRWVAENESDKERELVEHSDNECYFFDLLVLLSHGQHLNIGCLL